MELVQLDTAIGDGDHGTNMDRGMRAATEKLAEVDGDDIGALLKAVGMALISKVGGAAGPLYGTLFMRMATATAGKTELDLDGWTEAVEAGLAGVQQRGKAEPGDKTMVDALVPAVEALRAADGSDLAGRCARRPMRHARACSRRSRWRPARAARATSVRAAWTIRTRARHRPSCSCAPLPSASASSTLSNDESECASRSGAHSTLPFTSSEHRLTLSDARAYDAARR